jgi:hypothetical protein
VEHIVPESLGNTEKVLPVGVVCDRCNTLCSKLDRDLVEFGPIKMLKTTYGVPSKKGKLPRYEFNNGELQALGPNEIGLTLEDENALTDLPAPPGHRAFSFTAEMAGWTSKVAARVQRALIKQALEFVWLDLGEERALSSEFDRERRIILHGNHPGYLAIPREGTPQDAVVRMTYRLATRDADQQSLIFLVGYFWGVPIITDSLFPAPVRSLPEERFNVITFAP